MITAHSSSLIAYDYGINELRDGLRDMDLSDHQMNKMWDYVRELWNRQQGRQVSNNLMIAKVYRRQKYCVHPSISLAHLHTYHLRFIPEGVAEVSQIFLRNTHVLPK
jgi:hypothetical protein